MRISLGVNAKLSGSTEATHTIRSLSIIMFGKDLYHEPSVMTICN